MAFSEATKLVVKKKAMFKCCRCQSIGVEVHHIEPQHDNGEDTLDNAAPLCPNCHTWFGDNQLKQKEIRQMRDNWYETVERMYSGQASAIFPMVEKINRNLEEVKDKQSTNISEIKIMLKEVASMAIDNMTLGTANVTASNVVMASGASLSNVDLSDVHKIMTCPKCNEVIMYKDIDNPCPNCGSALY